MDASIIIPVFNKSFYTKQCLQKIIENTSPRYSFEIIIVDNNSTDDTRRIVNEFQSQHVPIKYLFNNENKGYGAACNLGSNLASGDELIFLNNDTEPQKYWLENGLDRMSMDRSIGILGAKLLYPDGKIQHCGIDFFENVNPDHLFWPLHRYMREDENYELANHAEEVMGVTGACMFIRKNLFDLVGGFDEQYWMYFEDLDLCFKVKKYNYKVYYDHDVIVIHHEGKSSPNQDKIDELNRKSGKTFFSKWRNEVAYEMLKKHFEYTTDRVTVVSENIYPESLLDNGFQNDMEKSKREYLAFFEKLNSLGNFYVHFGGAGDALLLLSTFYDDNPKQIVVSFANSTNALKSFWEPFEHLEHVYLIPLPPSYILHCSIRNLLPLLKNVRGMGATPKTDYEKEWGSVNDIYKEYGIKEAPFWIHDFKSFRVTDYQVTIAPKGSMVGMVGSKKNVISKGDWDRTLKYFLDRNIHPVVLGTPDESKEYPLIKGVIDKRSYSFKEQMQLINGSNIFIGADSWGKTFAAMANKKTFVFKPQMGADLSGWRDVSENIFIKPWKQIRLVKNFNDLRKEFSKITFLRRQLTVAIDGVIQNMNSLTKVNLSIAEQLFTNGHRVSLITSEKADSKIFQNLKNPLKKLVNSIKNPDVIISHYFPPKVKRPKCKKWIVIQPWEFGSTPKTWVDLFNTKADEVWVPSNFVKNIFTKDGVQSTKIKIIPNGFDPRIYHPSSNKYQLNTSKKIKLLFVGGTIYRKGIDVLLKAYLQAFNKCDDVTLIIKDVASNSVYKENNFKKEIKKIMDLDNSPEIIYMDNFMCEENLAELYNSCDFLVHPYRGEGFGMPVLEAMACGLIPIITDGGATDDFCNENNCIKIPSEKKYFEETKVDNIETVNIPYLLEPDLEIFTSILKDVYKNVDKIKSGLQQNHNQLVEKYSWGSIYNLIVHRIYDDESSESLSISSEMDLGKEYINYLIRADRYIVEKKYDLAKEYYEKSLKLQNNSPEACKGLAKIFLAEDNYEAAKTMFEYALVNNIDDDESFQSLLKINLQMNLENKISFTGRNNIKEELAEAEKLIEENKTLDAEETLLQMLSLNPFDIDVLNNFVVVKIMKEEYEIALKYLRRVFLLDQNNEVAKNNLEYIKELLAAEDNQKEYPSVK